MGKAFKPIHGGHDRGTMCPNCSKEQKSHAPFCEHCGAAMKKFSKKEMFDIQTAKYKATDYLREHMYTVIKRFKAVNGFYY